MGLELHEPSMLEKLQRDGAGEGLAQAREPRGGAPSRGCQCSGRVFQYPVGAAARMFRLFRASPGAGRVGLSIGLSPCNEEAGS